MNAKGNYSAIILRTSFGSRDRFIDFSGGNPPFLTPDAMKYLLDIGCEHLLVDLPSVDKENDQGFLASHSVFFGMPKRERSETETNPKAKSESEGNSNRRNCTITELCYIPNNIKDGYYILNLQLSPFLLDAVPSRPVIFPCVQ